jgi:hypothetical protein
LRDFLKLKFVYQSSNQSRQLEMTRADKIE